MAHRLSKIHLPGYSVKWRENQDRHNPHSALVLHRRSHPLTKQRQSLEVSQGWERRLSVPFSDKEKTILSIVGAVASALIGYLIWRHENAIQAQESAASDQANQD